MGSGLLDRLRALGLVRSALGGLERPADEPKAQSGQAAFSVPRDRQTLSGDLDLIDTRGPVTRSILAPCTPMVLRRTALRCPASEYCDGPDASMGSFGGLVNVAFTSHENVPPV